VKKAEEDLLAPQNAADDEEEDKEKGEEAEAGKSKGKGEKVEGEKYDGEDKELGVKEAKTDEMDALESPLGEGEASWNCETWAWSQIRWIMFHHFVIRFINIMKGLFKMLFFIT